MSTAVQAPSILNHARHTILISIPRTASNLVTRLLGLPSQLSILAHPTDGYFFLSSLSARFKVSTFTRPISDLSREEKEALDDALGQSASAWGAWVAAAENQGRGTFIKEHVNWMLTPSTTSSYLHSAPAIDTQILPSLAPSGDSYIELENPTVVRASFWKSINVTFLVRHPALVFPSTLRTAIDNEGLDKVLGEESESVMRWECTYRWHVLLYKFLGTLNSPPQPKLLIIDASQLQEEDFIRRYSEHAGLDNERLQTHWNAMSQQEQDKLHAVQRRMKDTLLSSSGIISSKLSPWPTDIEAERRNWEIEFGLILAERLERLVKEAMNEYEWLFDRRWGRASGS